MKSSDKPIQPYSPEARISFKRSDIAHMDRDEYLRNRNAILAAQREGLIEDDMSLPPSKMGSKPVLIIQDDETKT